jgi:NTP pyrophosphatase (non-canonical NTP hydrolase)
VAPSGDLDGLTQQIVKFRDERDWKKFHNPKDLALSLTLEAAEILELMQWKNGDELEAFLRQRQHELGAELADALYWTLLLAHEVGIDLKEAFAKKMHENAMKYPVAKSKGKSAKYRDL